MRSVTKPQALITLKLTQRCIGMFTSDMSRLRSTLVSHSRAQCLKGKSLACSERPSLAALGDCSE